MSRCNGQTFLHFPHQPHTLVIILDHFERFVTATDTISQTVLYSLFNFLQDRHTRIGCTAITTSIDVTDALDRAGLGGLFLNTPACSAHTSDLSSTKRDDVLWSGVPMITFPGSLFASRIAARLLTAAGGLELVAEDMKEYDGLTVELATNRARLAAIRAKLESTRYTNALFDTERFVRNVDELYSNAWQDFEQVKQPNHIFGQHVYDKSTMLSIPIVYHDLQQILPLPRTFIALGAKITKVSFRTVINGETNCCVRGSNAALVSLELRAV